MPLRRKKISQGDRDELQEVQRVADAQREEAWSLLSEAKKASIVLKESRKTNHYGLALDKLFGRA